MLTKIHLKKILSYLILITLLALIVSGCNSNQAIATFDAPKIEVPYDDIINKYGLSIYGDSQFSPKEIEEIFNMVKSIQDHPKIKELNIRINLYSIKIYRSGEYIVVATGFSSGPTSGAGNVLYLDHKSNGKFDLVKVSSWIS